MRWEGDERGVGVAGAAEHAPAVDRLLEAMGASDWVAEEPETHLVPHIRDALADGGLEPAGFETASDGELVVRLRAAGSPWCAA